MAETANQISGQDPALYGATPDPRELIPPPSVTFDEAAQAEKGFAEGFVFKFLNHNLTVAGEEVRLVKTYLDQVPADDSDKAFCRDPGMVAGYHEQLGALIGARLEVSTRGADDDTTSHLEQLADAFRARTAQGNVLARDYYHALSSWKSGKGAEPRPPLSVLDFHGFNVQTTEGLVDLLEKPLQGARPNMRLQRESFGELFVHWSSEAYQQSRMRDEDPGLQKRIYLNPRSEDAVAIFDEVISSADSFGLTVKGKILDRSAESLRELRENEEKFALRGDGIVLSAGEDADKLLSIVEDVYKRHLEAFAGRRTSLIPFRLADGFAVGEEPVASDVSLTNDRADFLEDVGQETRKQLGIEARDIISGDRRSEAVAMFVRVLSRMAPSYHISARNLAFNAA